MVSLSSFNHLSIATLKGVGPQTLNRLKKLNLITIQDLLFHLPIRYQDRTRLMPLGSVRPGDHAVVEGVIEVANIVQGKRRSLLCYLSDGTGKIILRFFYFNAAQQKQLSERGVRIRCYGEVRWGKSTLEMIHPEYRFCHEPIPVEEHLTPIYSTTDGISQHALRKLTNQALELLTNKPEQLADYLSPITHEFSSAFNLQQALHYVHRPPPDADQNLLLNGLHPAQQRLAFEELLAHQLSLVFLRKQTQLLRAPIIATKNSLLIEKFLTQLSFKLTAAQQRVVEEIKIDLYKKIPMLRLVQGDVGSGKTVVAALAALPLIENNYQVALMAPTELLAEQHYQNFLTWFKPLNISVTLVTSQLKGKARKDLEQEIAGNKIQLIVGTHALFQESLKFSKLGLIIIDEQHRFGVHQRLALREKGNNNESCPHQLIMTATPIPRTLAMTAYADLDCSIIDELPPGRIPINTLVVSNQRRPEIIQRVRQNCLAGKQAYWVCTLITESELLQCQAAENTYQQLMQALPELKIGLIHGRLPAQEKEKIMQAFKDKNLDLLIATTVIEVGVDIPNATLMIIENPERLGLAQLHQLRGRIGRGALQSHCVLLYQTPLSQQAKQRLTIMRDSHDGFVIAQKDLEMRGPGEVLGTRQTGLLQFKIADLLRDKLLLEKLSTTVQLLLQNFSQQAELLVERWLSGTDKYRQV